MRRHWVPLCLTAAVGLAGCTPGMLQSLLSAAGVNQGQNQGQGQGQGNTQGQDQGGTSNGCAPGTLCGGVSSGQSPSPTPTTLPNTGPSTQPTASPATLAQMYYFCPPNGATGSTMTLQIQPGGSLAATFYMDGNTNPVADASGSESVGPMGQTLVQLTLTAPSGASQAPPSPFPAGSTFTAAATGDYLLGQLITSSGSHPQPWGQTETEACSPPPPPGT